MPKYSFYLNNEDDKTILAYGELLADQGLIKRPVNKYKIGKYIFTQIIKSYKDKQPKIITENTPLEKETIVSKPIEETEVEETDLHKTYKGLR